MTDLIKRVMNGENVEITLEAVLGSLHANGPINHGDLELLSYVKLYQPDIFLKYEKTILNLMGLYFKDELSTDDDIRGVVSNLLGKGIAEKYGHAYTPVQANLIEKITENRLFSFSSATSTGKSHVFRDLILGQNGDMVIVVPSRALINEYFTRTLKIVDGMPVNVLVFPDIVNTAMAERNVFILTPERVKDLFKLKEQLQIETVLFDEAQIAEDDGRRGIYFDSIVRRVNEHFSEANMLFAQPYIDNPEAQFARNKLADNSKSDSKAYPYRNVGQVFISVSGDRRYDHFAIDKLRLGRTRIALGYDPIERCLSIGGSVLVYVSKSSIYTGKALEDLSVYVDQLNPVDDADALGLIARIEELLGGSPRDDNPYHSDLLSLLGHGIVVHHGSLPLQARFLIEEFINRGYCRICFATSTLYQGVNMPFDIVYLKKLDRSKSLLVKNLIGRAGRSTTRPVFDFGQVIVNLSGMSDLRNIIAGQDIMRDESQIDIDNPDDDEDLAEFKQAIRNGQLNDAYNLTTSQIERLSSPDTIAVVASIIEILFSEGRSVVESYRDLSAEARQYVIDKFKSIFRYHVKNRELSDGEDGVLESALRIFMYQIGGRNLRSIIEARFSSIARVKERRGLEATRDIDPRGYARGIADLHPISTMPAQEIPNKNLQRYGLFKYDTPIKKVGYDLVMYDTYDYIDKIWGFNLADIFYAAFDVYYTQTLDVRAQTICKYIRYATIDETEIWLLRYGFSFEDIEWIKPLVRFVDETMVRFGDISGLSEDQLAVIGRYLPKEIDPMPSIDL